MSFEISSLGRKVAAPLITAFVTQKLTTTYVQDKFYSHDWKKKKKNFLEQRKIFSKFVFFFSFGFYFFHFYFWLRSRAHSSQLERVAFSELARLGLISLFQNLDNSEIFVVTIGCSRSFNVIWRNFETSKKNLSKNKNIFLFVKTKLVSSSTHICNFLELDKKSIHNFEPL